MTKPSPRGRIEHGFRGVAIPMVTRPDAAERCGYAADEAVRLGGNRRLWDLTR